jgi:hypothetical protein
MSQVKFLCCPNKTKKPRAHTKNAIKLAQCMLIGGASFNYFISAKQLNSRALGAVAENGREHSLATF